MKSIPVSDFASHLHRMVPVDIPLVAEDAIVKAAIRFCRDTRILIAYREIDLVFAGQLIGAVANSAMNRRELAKLKAFDLLRVKSGNEILTAPNEYYLPSLDEIRFLNDYENVIIMSIAEPAADTKYLPDVLFNDWLTAICHGAAAQICAMAGTPPEVAQFLAHHERNFVEAIDQAKRWRMESATVETVPERRIRKRDFF